MKSDFRGVVYFNSITLAVLIGIGYTNMLFFHTLIELSTVFLALSIYIVAVYSREYSKNNLLIFIGIAYIFIGIFDLFHTLTSEHLGVFNMSGNISTELWLGARLMESSILFIAYFYIIKSEKLNLRIVYIIFMAVTAFIFIVSVYGNFMPVLYAVDSGYSTFKYFLDALIVIFLILALVFIRKNESRDFNKKILTIAILLKIVSEVAYVFSLQDGNAIIIISLLTKYLSYIALFVVFGRDSLARPYESIFYAFKQKEKELIELSQKDSLSGLYNHSMIFEKLDELIIQNDFDDTKLCLMMIDIDDFKGINDNYGHIKGDEIIVEIANLFKTCSGPISMAGRYGGDEFAIAFSKCDNVLANEILDKIYSRIEKMSKDLNVQLGLSIGVVIWETGMDSKMLVKKADLLMYKSKENGKNQFTF